MSEFDKAAEKILAARKSPRKAADSRQAPSGPQWHEVAERDDSQAVAFAKGVEAGIENIVACCGCGGSGPIVNIYDGSTIK